MSMFYNACCAFPVCDIMGTTLYDEETFTLFGPHNVIIHFSHIVILGMCIAWEYSTCIYLEQALKQGQNRSWKVLKTSFKVAAVLQEPWYCCPSDIIIIIIIFLQKDAQQPDLQPGEMEKVHAHQPLEESLEREKPHRGKVCDAVKHVFIQRPAFLPEKSGLNLILASL